MELAFNRKYRPKSINEYIGDSIKNEILSRFSDEKNYPQSILLYGSRGCGKTSAARLIAKEYFCESKVNGHACGECEMCKEIEEYIVTGVDNTGAIKEIDIASENKKDDIDNMLDDAMTRPMFPLNYKVLIFDECHMATHQAQNRLLKILEEPPKHLVFIFCTTNPEKLLDTVRSRCQLQIEVRKPSRNDLMELLKRVCIAEGITTSTKVLDLIIKKKDRTPREVLSLLEELSISYNKKIRYEDVIERFNDIANELFIEFYRASKDGLESILKFESGLRAKDIPFTKFLNNLMEFTLESISIRFGVNEQEYPLSYVKTVKEMFDMYSIDELNFILYAIEYALKYSMNDESYARLHTITLALRLNKDNLIAELSQERNKVAIENNESVIKYSKNRDEENSKKDTSNKDINDQLLIDTFGSIKSISENINIGINDNKNISIEDIEASDDEDSDSEKSDEEFIRQMKELLDK